eukprot:13729836-Alexandrium_andersonii.AAC.1
MKSFLSHAPVSAQVQAAIMGKRARAGSSAPKGGLQVDARGSRGCLDAASPDTMSVLRRLAHIGAPRVLLKLVLFVRQCPGVSEDRWLSSLELFAGEEAVTRGIRRTGRTAVGHGRVAQRSAIVFAVARRRPGHGSPGVLDMGLGQQGHQQAVRAQAFGRSPGAVGARRQHHGVEAGVDLVAVERAGRVLGAGAAIVLVVV